MSTATIHRCSECKHQSADHTPGDAGGWRPKVGPCSMGGCACRLTIDQVISLNPAVEVQTWPGFNHATGRWGA